MSRPHIRLLVVDDAPFIREIVRHVVENNGIEIVGEASDGVEAVALALALKPDIILMDMIMPNKTGIEATKEIMSQLPQTKVVAFSTADQDHMVSRALEAGCRNFLVKPFRAEDLVRVINESLKI